MAKEQDDSSRVESSGRERSVGSVSIDMLLGATASRLDEGLNDATERGSRCLG